MLQLVTLEFITPSLHGGRLPRDAGPAYCTRFHPLDEAGGMFTQLANYDIRQVLSSARSAVICNLGNVHAPRWIE